MSLPAGHKIAHYELLEPIGKGGMGEVYRAHDTKLGRDVAIKVLPDELAQDEERLRRFQREAKVLASLNHPNIAGIYGLERSDNTHCLVLELVPGETLAERIARGPIPVDEALTTARKIVEGLEEAHEQGIVHRDLKPANVKLTPDDKVKILDFGLAKALVEESPDVDSSMSPTITRDATRVGVILGTAAYMSPEQAKGKRVDKRTDIFAFGAVLYEMLSGKKAFPGEDVSEVLAAVIKSEPDWSRLPSAVPASLGKLMHRCLEKDTRRRLRDIGDARADIEDALAGPAEGARGRATPIWRAWLPWSVAAVVAIAAVTVWFESRSERKVLAKAAHVQISVPDGVELAVDTEHPVLALSPDGRRLVFVGEEDGIRHLYLRDLAAIETRALPGTEGAASPFFSPDGGWVAFLAGDYLIKKVPINGGVPVAVQQANGPGVSRGATWSMDDTVIIAGSANSGLDRGSLSGETLRSIEEWEPLTDPSAPFAWPNAVTGGNVVFTDHREGFLDDARIAFLDVKTGEIGTVVLGATYPRYSQTNHLLFARSGSLFAVPFDPQRGRVVGSEQKLLEGVITEENGAAQFAVASDGTIAYIAGGSAPREHTLVWVDRMGQTELLLGGRQFLDPRLSPDGRRLLVTSPTGANFDIWLLDIERHTFTRLTSDPGEDLHAVWSPDGSRLGLASEINQVAGGPALAWMPSLNATPQVLIDSPGWGNWEFPSSWSPDGRWLAYRSERLGQSDIWLMPMSEAGDPIPFLDAEARECAPMFSPDGAWIAYVSNVSGRDEVYVRSFPDPSERVVQISSRGGIEPVWARDGRELFYREGNRVMVVEFGDGVELEPSAPKVLFEGRFRKTRWGANTANYDVSLDGSRFLMVQDRNGERPKVIHLVLNWPAAL